METSLVHFCFLFFTWLLETFKWYVACILFLLDRLCAQSCPGLCNPMDCSPPGSSVHGIFQARILAWIAIFFSRGSSWPRDWTESLVSPALAGGFFTTGPLGMPPVGLSCSRKISASCPDAITDIRLVLLLKTTVKPNKIYETVLFRHSSKGSVVLERRET